MNRFQRNCLTVAISSVLLVTAVNSAPAAVADATLPFGVRFVADANGSIAIVGNTLMTCPSNLTTCAAARAGGSYDNNNYSMVNLDADGAAYPDTYNSSMAALALPDGASVLWAGLYWGARQTAGSSGQAAPNTYNQMSLRLPGEAAYRTIQASTARDAQFGPNPDSYNAYQRYAEVTALVSAAGGGAYWGANVAAATGSDRYAGWALVVVYSAPGMPLRNLTVFDGFAMVGSASQPTIAISGFTAPKSGPVQSQIGMVAYEGDLTLTGDYVKLNGSQLATALSPGSDFFNSSDDANGVSVAERNPADKNMFGFDIKNVAVSGVIPNNATSATFQFASTGDVYYPGVLTTAIDLYAPDFSPSTKTASNLSGHFPARPGDIISYTVNYSNIGQDASTATVSQDPIPAGTSYVPGSLQLISGATITSLSDAAGDDVGEFDGDSVRVRLGAGSSASAGGTIASGAGAGYSFQVQVTAAAAGQAIANLVHLNYRTATTGVAGTYDIAPVLTPVATGADVSITKTMGPVVAANGQPITAVLTIANAGPGDATGVQVFDPILDGWAGVAWDLSGAPGAACALTGGTVACSLPGLDAGASAVIALTGAMPPATPASQTALANVAQVSTTSYDPDLSNNVSSASVQILPRADLSITKTADPSAAAPGERVSYTLAVANAGPSDATAVTISDLVGPGGLSLVSASSTTAGVTCGTVAANSAACTMDRLAVGGSASVTIVGVLASGSAPGAVDNTASVGSAVADPDPSNNSATAVVGVGPASADVALAKTVSPATLVAGAPVTYTITASNLGPSDASGVVVTDQLPSAVLATNAVSDRGSCQIDNQTVTCPLGALAVGLNGGVTTSTITIQGLVAADAPSTIDNTATVTTASVDPNPANDTATASAPVGAQADLSVTKIADTTILPNLADPVTYTITVHNHGPSAARDVAIHDVVSPQILALGVAPELPDGAQCGDLADGVLDCALGDLAVGADAVVVLRTLATEKAAGELAETVTVSSSTPDPVTGNNTASWTLADQEQADLAITKQATTSTFNAGQVGTYELVVVNNGPSGSTPVVTDTLDERLTLLAAGAEGSDTSGECTASGQVVTCAWAGDQPLADAGQWTVRLSVAVSPDVGDGTLLANSAHVTGDVPDPATGNNDSTVVVPVVARANMRATSMVWQPFSGEPDGLYQPVGDGVTSSVDASSFVWLTMTFTNTGSATARDVSLVLDYDLDMSNISVDQSPLVVWNGDLLDADSPDQQCVLVAGGLYCPFDNDGGTAVPPQGSVTVHMLLVALPDAPVSAGAAHVHVATTTPESDQTDNDAQAPLSINPGLAQPAIVKTATNLQQAPGVDGDVWVAGGPFSYTLEIWQPCPAQTELGGTFCATIPDAQVSDHLPAGFHAKSVTTTQGSCAISQGDDAAVSCAIGTIPGTLRRADEPPPDHIMVTVFGVIDPDVRGSVTNWGSVAADLPNPEDPDNPRHVAATGAATVTVVQQADLRLYKSADATAASTADGRPVVHAGNEVGYTLTALNVGPSESGPSTITDTLPLGLSLDPAKSPACQVAAPGDVAAGVSEVVACAVGALGPGASQSVRLVASSLPQDIRLPGSGPGCPDCPEYARLPRDIVNQAVVAPDDPAQIDLDPTNNTSSAGAELDALADVAVALQVDAANPAAGDTLTYTVVMGNNGPSVADFPYLDLVFPAGFVVESTSLPGYQCQTAYDADQRGSVHCEADPVGPYYQTLSFGQSVTGVVTVALPADTASGTYSATARAGSQTPDADRSNNMASVDVEVRQIADTSVVKTLVSSELVAGQQASYRLTVVNHGPSAADNVVVSDTVPTGMAYVSAVAEATGAACPDPHPDPPQHEDQTVLECPVARVEVDDPVTILVTFQIDSDATGQEICNTALVGSAAIDMVSDDNQSTVCATVAAPPAPDLRVSKTVGPAGQARAGDELTYLLTFANSGTASADVDYLDDLSGVLDDAVLGEVLSDPGLVARVDGSSLSISGTVAAGQTLVVRYTVTVGADGQRGDDVLFNAAFPADTAPPDRPNQDTPLERCPVCTSTTVVPGPSPSGSPTGSPTGSPSGEPSESPTDPPTTTNPTTNPTDSTTTPINPTTTPTSSTTTPTGPTTTPTSPTTTPAGPTTSPTSPTTPAGPTTTPSTTPTGPATPVVPTTTPTGPTPTPPGPTTTPTSPTTPAGPTTTPSTPTGPATPVVPTTTPTGPVYYENCAAARAAGATPLHRGDPGYRAGLDGDNDGVACENTPSGPTSTPTGPTATPPGPTQPPTAPTPRIPSGGTVESHTGWLAVLGLAIGFGGAAVSRWGLATHQ